MVKCILPVFCNAKMSQYYTKMAQKTKTGHELVEKTCVVATFLRLVNSW